ncbi:MAG: BBP7 family outer membrane beta-barrel protein [Pirellulales bacterium]|nr:BBP7 family outer membrane beta-barrel protein [Pirellulales bacterium]
MALQRLLVPSAIWTSCLVLALTTDLTFAQQPYYGAPPVSSMGGYPVAGSTVPPVSSSIAPSGYPATSYPHPVTYAGSLPARVAQTGPVAEPPAVPEPALPAVPPDSASNGVMPPAMPLAVPYSFAVPGQIFNGPNCPGGCQGTDDSCEIIRRAYRRGGCGCGGGCRHWFGGIYGLVMTRDDENGFSMTWIDSAADQQLLSIRDASPGWQGGNELRVGSTFACHPLAWEFVAWGLYGESGQEVVTSAEVAGALNSMIDFTGLEYDNGTISGPVNDWYNDAQMHRVFRYFEAQNLEMNLFYFPMSVGVGPYGPMIGGYGYGIGGLGARGINAYGNNWDPCSVPCIPRFSIVASAGFRYMRIAEWLDLDTDDADTTFGSNEDELFYDIDTKNHLFGFQLGCAANYRLTNRLSVYCDGKYGIYNNHIQHRSLIWGEGGFAVVAPGEPYAGQNFDVESTKDDFAMLGELRLGVTYQFAEHWQVYGGYRVIGVSGVALPSNQIPMYFADTAAVGVIDSNGSMILHGAQFGVELVY